MFPLRFVAVIAASAVVLLVRSLRKRRSAQRAIRTMFATQFEYDAAQARKRRFLAAHPAYGYPAARQPIDSWRPRELPGLLPPLGAPMCDNAMVYLDYAGAALPLSSQLARVAELASASIVLANPHSTGPAAAAAAAAIERARRCVLQHFCGASSSTFAARVRMNGSSSGPQARRRLCALPQKPFPSRAAAARSLRTR